MGGLRRIIYMAGVTNRKRAAVADCCPYWLLSVAELPSKGPSAWLEPYLKRAVLWDPGTFADDAPSLPQYRDWIKRWAQPHHQYLSYDEIGGDPDLNMAYLTDLRRRGFNPIPVYHYGMPLGVLAETRVAIGGLVKLSENDRKQRLDWLFYGDGRNLTGRVHLLGMGQRRWFERYPATSGDSTTWVPRFPWNRERGSIQAWMQDYGEWDIPLTEPAAIQGRLIF